MHTEQQRIEKRQRAAGFFVRAVKGETFKQIGADVGLSGSRVSYLADWGQRTIAACNGEQYQMLTISQVRKDADRWLKLAEKAKEKGYKLPVKGEE